MRKLVVIALLTALAVPAPALAVDRNVSMQGNRFNPSALQALTGDTVIWTNNEFLSTKPHNVTSQQFQSSGELDVGQQYSVIFNAPGSYSYVCTNHRTTMIGRVTVAAIHLAGPAATLNHGGAARFSGLAQPGAAVTIHAANGTQVAAASAGPDGSFSAVVPLVRPDSYRARAGSAQSSAVRVAVRPRLTLTSRRSGTRLALTVAATPSQSGAPVVVQRRAGSRWVKIAGGRLNGSSKATFRVARMAMKIRARTTRGVGGYSPATSRVLGVR